MPARLLLTSYLLLITSYVLADSVSVLAQNMPHEAGLLIAVNGQSPLIAASDVNRGFYTNPAIEHAYYSVLTNGIQSLALFGEHVQETRSWHGLWTDLKINGGSQNFLATVQERLQMTTIGLETVRTLVSEYGLRFG